MVISRAKNLTVARGIGIILWGIIKKMFSKKYGGCSIFLD
jgi:hypothetical protein